MIVRNDYGTMSTIAVVDLILHSLALALILGLACVWYWAVAIYRETPAGMPTNPVNKPWARGTRFRGGYGFAVYDPAHTTWNDIPGVYIFAGLDTSQRWWHAAYIGQTTSFSSRLPSHEQWWAATQQGATHIHARVVQDEYQRIAIESALIQSYQPPLNRTRD